MERSLSIKRLKRLLIQPEWKLNVFVRKLTFDDAVEIFYILLFYALKWTLCFQNSWLGLSLSSNTFLCVPYVLLRRFIWLYEWFCQYHLDKEYIQSAERRSYTLFPRFVIVTVFPSWECISTCVISPTWFRGHLFDPRGFNTFWKTLYLHRLML